MVKTGDLVKVEYLSIAGRYQRRCYYGIVVSLDASDRLGTTFVELINDEGCLKKIAQRNFAECCEEGIPWVVKGIISV